MTTEIKFLSAHATEKFTKTSCQSELAED